MLNSGPVKQFAGAVMGLSLFVASSAANAAPSASPISPMVALSAFGTPASASAVRPVVPSAANLQMTAAATAAQSDYDNGGYSNLIPMLIVLGIIVAAGIIVFSGNSHGHIQLPSASPD
jgi:hypothetical protein